MNKRVAIGIAAALAGLVLITTLGLLFAGGDRRLGAQKTTYSGARFAVEIDGYATMARSVKGCDVGADVIEAQPGADNIVRKHISQPLPEPCVIEVGASMGKGAFDWIRGTLANQSPTKTVKITQADFNYKAKSYTTLENALLTKVTFPALGGSSKDAAYIELTIQPEQVKKSPGDDASVASKLGGKQKAWLASNFSFELGTLPGARVATISSLEVTQKVAQDNIGESRIATKTPSTLRVGNVVLEVSVQDRQAWDTWFDDFVIKGLNAQANEMTGAIKFLAPNHKDVLFTLSLSGVGVFKAAGPALEANSEKVARRTYWLYIEELAFDSTEYGSSATGSVSPTAPPPAAPQPTPQPAPTVPIEATITPVSAELLLDGETFTISDGVNEPTVFEFVLDGTLNTKAGVAVNVTKGAPAEEVAAAIVEAINGVPENLEIVAKSTETEVIQLRSERGAEAGEEKILEFVESEEFTARDAIPAEKGLPAPATLKAATGGAKGEIELSWAASEGALGYLVLATTEPGGEFNELDKADGTELTVAGLESGVTYHFIVRALDGTRQSPNSPEASAPAG